MNDTWDFDKYPIDLVYLWVDGNDKDWQKRRVQKLTELGIYKKDDSINECRFIDNDELKYSLRSVEAFAPWIRQIYIVTDRQVPRWLNLNNSKIKIIDHTQILPRSALPTYNSMAIETCLANIPDLSELFLFANDDTFIASPVTPYFFFEDYKPILRFGKAVKKKNNIHHCAILNAQKLIYEKYKVKITNGMQHNIDAYKKSDIVACNKLFKENICKTTNSSFRDSRNISRIIYSYYSYIVGHGKFKSIQKVNNNQSLIRRIFKLLFTDKLKDSVLIDMHSKNKGTKLLKSRASLFCLNDSEKTTSSDRCEAKMFLENLFPNKSSFEL